MKNAHVIGLGKSGVAAARLLKRDGWQVTLSDRSQGVALSSLQQALVQDGIAVQLGHPFVPEAGINLVVVSPGVPWDNVALLDARELGIETIGEMELAWRYLQDRPWVGITGTNGKTTTTALIAAIFQAAGYQAPACGNIGYAACELALADTIPDWVIAEVSSYQIESSSTLAPRVGVWTTFTPDHLNRHKTLENYYAIKASLLYRSEVQVLNGDDPYLRQQGGDDFPEACWTSVQGRLVGDTGIPATTYLEDGWVISQGQPILPADSLGMVGDHNLQNLLMAVTAARLAEIEVDAIASAVQAFPGVSHRLETIGTWQGVTFINDSKATNYDAAEVGLRSVASPAILIAGGEAKEGDDTAWLAQIKAKAAAVLLIGSAAPAFAERLQQVGYDAYEIVETMDRAVGRGADLSQKHGATVVLLSPACASFDQYANFEQRGDHFRQICWTQFGEN